MNMREIMSLENCNGEKHQGFSEYTHAYRVQISRVLKRANWLLIPGGAPVPKDRAMFVEKLEKITIV